jgi:restriction endonuclease S subunit
MSESIISPASETRPYPMDEKTTMTTKTTLPAGWRWVKLGEICSILNGYAFDSGKFSSGGTPLIRIRDLKTNSPSVFFSDKFSKTYLVEPGSLLVGMDGEFQCHRWAGPVSLLNQRVCRLVPNQELLDKDFLYYSPRELCFGIMAGQAAA